MRTTLHYGQFYELCPVCGRPIKPDHRFYPIDHARFPELRYCRCDRHRPARVMKGRFHG